MDVYEKFDKATARLSAYALIRDGKPIGRVVIKFGNAATAFVQIWGAPMATYRATGYGYDKASAAVWGAVDRLTDWPPLDDSGAYDAFYRLHQVAQSRNSGASWRSELEKAGFTLARVIG